jgi:hypothetical protein
MVYVANTAAARDTGGKIDQSESNVRQLRPTSRSQVQGRRSEEIMDVEWAELFWYKGGVCACTRSVSGYKERD